MSTHSKIKHHGNGSGLGDHAFFDQNGWLPIPRLVQWMVTLRCPLSCPHCLAEDDHSPDMSIEQATDLIRQVAEMQVPEFLLTGGEPLARPDMPEILAVLRDNHVRWSLNTAVMPDKRLQKAIEGWPPVFVAVSLDGPASVHNRFRGHAESYDQAIQSIGYFASLGIEVAAGTTVTSRNYRHLGETFSIVLSSGASRWGLHLLVPEGRAADRKRLFLSHAQLKGLLAFAADKRKYFPVTMADEIGYCGAWEPLVRDAPFFCGAGRAGCVVLPDGEVVPCTTLDRTTSAGNIHNRSLREIWETGFAELRECRPNGKCATCGYASACQGGCWLQRRHGSHCYRETWHTTDVLKTAAGIAVCLGLTSVGGNVLAQDSVPVVPSLMHGAEGIEASAMEALQRSIVQWYAAQSTHRSSPNAYEVNAALRKALPDDPGAAYFLKFAAGERPDAIADRARQIAAAFQTSRRSLCLVGLAWRDVTEWCLDGPPPQERSDADRKALREVTAIIAQTAEVWRTEIFKEKLDPFLRRPLQYRHFFMSKAGPSPLQRVEGDLAMKRWGGGKDVTEHFLTEHPYAETMTLKHTLADGADLKCLRDGKTIDADGVLRVFDLLLVPNAGDGKPVKLVFAFAGGHTMEVQLPAGTELTYGDILRLAHEQNPSWYDGFFWREMLQRGHSPLALPELRRRMREHQSKPENAGEPVPSEIIWPLSNLYLF